MASLYDILKSVGFQGEGLKMAYAIAMAESSGNPGAHNGNAGTGDNSYGLFQINMLGDMGPERRKRYGLSSNDDLLDPYINARVAFQMSNGGKNWGAWSTYNNGMYKSFYGGSGQLVNMPSGGGGGATSSRATGGEGSPTPAVTPPSRAELAEQYGFVEAIFNSVPELKTLFNKAVKGGWTSSKFQAELRNTNWWKRTPETTRKWLTLQASDPATARQQLDQQAIKLKQLSASLGGTTNDKNIRDFAIKSLMNGWTDSQLRYELSKSITLKGDTRFGEAGENYDKLASFAYEMGLKQSDGWLGDAAKKITSGMASSQMYEDMMRRQAKAMFPEWAKQIDAGQTVADLMSPYFQSMSTILELPPGSINLFDPTIRKTLYHKDPKTGQGIVKPMWQFENELRNDPRWKKTKNAQDSSMQIAHQVLSDFGLVF